MLPQAFCEKLHALLGEEYEEYLASLDSPRAVGLRLNPLKMSLRGWPADGPRQSGSPAILNAQFAAFKLTPVPWEPTGFYYDPASRPGLHPFHDAGVYYLQEPSAMAPAVLLDPQPGERDPSRPGEDSLRQRRAPGHRQCPGPQRAPGPAGGTLRGLFRPRPGGRALLRRRDVPQA